MPRIIDNLAVLNGKGDEVRHNKYIFLIFNLIHIQSSTSSRRVKKFY
jgi:hypothetical protein